MKQFYSTAVKVSLGVLIIAVVISLFGFIDINYFILRHSAAIGTYLLFVMIGLKSIYFIIKKQGNTEGKVYKFLRKNNMYQREQGLIVFNIIFIHIIMTTFMFMNDLNTLVYYYLSAIIPTLILIYMEITSFRPFQKLIKRWKQHHSFVWLIVPLVYLHVIMLSSASFKYLILGLIILIIGLIEKLVGLKRGTKHLTYLMIGAIFTVGQFVVTQGVTKYQASEEKNYTQMELSSETNQGSVESEVALSDVVTEESQTVSEAEPENQIYEDGTYTGSGQGHRGTIEVQTTIEDDQIISIDVISENEDEKWWQPVISTLPNAIIANNGVEGVDGIAGSTHSSDGLLSAVEESLEQAEIQA